MLAPARRIGQDPDSRMWGAVCIEFHGMAPEFWHRFPEVTDLDYSIFWHTFTGTNLKNLYCTLNMPKTREVDFFFFPCTTTNLPWKNLSVLKKWDYLTLLCQIIWVLKFLTLYALTHGASFPGTCTVLLPSSLLREAVPGLYTSHGLAGHWHLSALPGRNRARRCGISKTTWQALLARIYSKQTLWKLFSPPHLRRLWVILYTWTLQFTTGHVRPFSIVSLSTTSLHGLMLVRDSKSRCTSDSTLTVTCYKNNFSHRALPAVLSNLTKVETLYVPTEVKGIHRDFQSSGSALRNGGVSQQINKWTKDSEAIVPDTSGLPYYCRTLVRVPKF